MIEYYNHIDQESEKYIYMWSCLWVSHKCISISILSHYDNANLCEIDWLLGIWWYIFSVEQVHLFTYKSILTTYSRYWHSSLLACQKVLLPSSFISISFVVNTKNPFIYLILKKIAEEEKLEQYICKTKGIRRIHFALRKNGNHLPFSPLYVKS